MMLGHLKYFQPFTITKLFFSVFRKKGPGRWWNRSERHCGKHAGVANNTLPPWSLTLWPTPDIRRTLYEDVRQTANPCAVVSRSRRHAYRGHLHRVERARIMAGLRIYNIYTRTRRTAMIGAETLIRGWVRNFKGCQRRSDQEFPVSSSGGCIAAGLLFRCTQTAVVSIAVSLRTSCSCPPAV